MITARAFFFRSVLAGLVVGTLVGYFDLFRANLWLENLSSPVASWFRSKDCASLASTLSSSCAAAHARAVPPELVAAADAIDREQEAMRTAWLAVKFPDPPYVTYYLRVEPPSKSHDARLDHAQDEGSAATALRMTVMAPLVAP